MRMLAGENLTELTALAAVRVWDEVGRVMFWSGVLIAALMALFVLLTWLRRRMRPGAHKPQSERMTVEQIEAIRRSGRISDEEFSRLRRIALGLDAGPEAKDNSALTPPEKRDDENGGGDPDARTGSDQATR